MYICMFCEYEDIFGVPPLALIRSYEIRDRKERKKKEEQRRLLEKARAKGKRGGRKGGGGGKAGGKGGNAAGAGANLPPPANGLQQPVSQQGYDADGTPLQGLEGEEQEFYDDEEEEDEEEYDDDEEEAEFEGEYATSPGVDPRFADRRLPAAVPVPGTGRK